MKHHTQIEVSTGRSKHQDLLSNKNDGDVKGQRCFSHTRVPCVLELFLSGSE